ncbi:acyltransferase family protein [Alkalibacillus sp. S2W]|uniref:acyltransferase family protein n=1 Tax=Alkalibacillus sp. S2W TaxID=3386553 RepID=UPI00398D0276
MFVLFIVSIPIQYIWLNKLYVDHLHLFGEFSYIVDDRSFILNWIAYFMLGAVLAQYYDEISSFTKKHLSLFSILFGVLMMSIYIEIEPGQLFTSTRVVNIIYIPIFTLFLLAFSKLFIDSDQLYKPFKLIGDYSMGIYLVHPFMFIIYFLNIYLPDRFFEPELIVITVLFVSIISTLTIRLISLIPKSTFIVPIPKVNR